MANYEVLRERFRITEWRDGAVFNTVSEGYVWIDPDDLAANRPTETWNLYAPPSTSYEGQTIRSK